MKSIKAFGEGHLINLFINSELKAKRLNWRESFELVDGVHVKCDGRVRYKMKPGDVWKIDSMKSFMIQNNF